jgi:hypothetical protein
LLQAADAATTPSPTRSTPAQPITQRVATASQRAATTPLRVAQSAQLVREHSGRLRRSVWSPLAHFSSVLWLQVTGTFYVLIAALLGQSVWTHRAALHLSSSSPDARRFYLLALLFALFAYFAVSNFVRAALRERR